LHGTNFTLLDVPCLSGDLGQPGEGQTKEEKQWNKSLMEGQTKEEKQWNKSLMDQDWSPPSGLTLKCLCLCPKLQTSNIESSLEAISSLHQKHNVPVKPCCQECSCRTSPAPPQTTSAMDLSGKSVYAFPTLVEHQSIGAAMKDACRTLLSSFLLLGSLLFKASGRVPAGRTHILLLSLLSGSVSHSISFRHTRSN